MAKDLATNKQPRSLAIATRGVKTGGDFANLMSALMSDLIEGRVTPQMGNATCNAGGKLLKVVEMQYKYGTQAGDTGKKTLTLCIEEVRD
jgi:phage tail sheath protein FI